VLVAEKTVTIERTQDAALVKSIITHPRIYPSVTDDGAPRPELFDASEAVKHKNVYFLLARAGEELLGCFMLHSHNAVLYEVHTCLLPNAWGPRAVEAGVAGRRWMFANTPCEKIMTFVPQGNGLAFKFAKRCGMQLEGILTKSYKKGGKLLDQSLLGVAKETVCR